MRVLHVISALDARAGGPIAALRGLAESQHAAGMAVRVLATTSASDDTGVADDLRASGLGVTLVGPCRTSLRWHAALARTVRSAIDDADVVHIHGLWEEVQYRAAVTARKAGVAHVIRPCGMLDPWSLARSARRKRIYLGLRLWRVLDRCTAIHYTTLMERDETIRIGLTTPAIIEPNGVALREFETLPEPGTFRRRYSAIGDRPLIVFMGRIHEGKGVDHLVRAIGSMKRQDAVLAIVGPDSGGYQQQIESIVAQHNISDRLIWTGMLRGDDRIAALTDADLFCLPSDHENFGVAVIEALAAGTPVIVSDEVGLRDRIAEAGVGEVVPNRNPKALAEALDHWIDDDDRREAAGGRARPFVWANFDWQRIAAHWGEHYGRLIAWERSATDGHDSTDAHQSRPLRVVAQQPSLRRYRVPVFRELAARLGIALTLVHGTSREEMADQSAGQAAGFAAIWVPMKRLMLAGRQVRWYPPQWSFATRRRADVLILPWDLACLTLLPALLRARLSGVGVVLWGHGYSKQERPWRKWLRTCIGRLGHANALYNRTTAQRFIDDGYPAERVFVALNSLDQSPIQQSRQDWIGRPDDLRAFRDENHLGDGPMILFVSRLYRENRADMLIDAAATLRERFPSLRLVIIGAGPDLERLRQLAEQHGVSDITRFPGAVYGEDRLAPWFLCADVFCYPVNIGLSILHAFGYGVPVVTSDRVEAQNPEIEALRDGENGLLYRHGDLSAMIDALSSLFAGDGRRRAMAEAAHRTVVEDFNIERMVDGLEQAIRYAAGRRR